ncbi:MAG: O-antigen ligase family protein [Oscillospiraceae bacterium]|jgi:O-antigen ligase|nr:O-antigen ligase family protein [Oscillospiraceae bacterium]
MEKHSVGLLAPALEGTITGEHTVMQKEKNRTIFSGILSVPADDIVVSLLLISIILGVYTAGAAVVLTALYAIINPRTKALMAKSPMLNATLFIFPLVMLPAVFTCFKYYFLNVRPSISQIAFNRCFLCGVFICLIFVVLLYLLTTMTKERFSRMTDIVLAISMISSVCGLFERITQDSDRVSFIYSNPNLYGYCIELFSLIALYKFVESKRLLYLVIFAANVGSIVLCDCRTAWPALFVSIAVMAVYKKKKARYIAIAVVLAIIFAVIVFSAPEIFPRFAYKSINSSFIKRMDMWYNSIRFISRNPIIGYGTGSYLLLSTASPDVRTLMHAHNLFLNILLDFGIIGAAAFINFFLRLYQKMFNATQRIKLGNIGMLVAGAFSATLIHGFTDVVMLSTSTSLLFVLVISGVAAASNTTVDR